MQNPLSLAFGIALLMGSSVQALDFAVAMAHGPDNRPMEVPITASDLNGLTALACTVTFDTAILDVTASLPRFKSFAATFSEDAADLPTATSATVDGQDYSSPVVLQPLPGRGLAIAAARRVPVSGAPPNSVLVLLSVSLKPGQPAGLYEIHIEPTVAHQGAAGYPAGGETVDLAVGRDALADSYPLLLPAAGSAVHLLPGYAHFHSTVDTDGDGLPDDWEIQHYGGIGAVGADDDTDKDTLTSLMEFFMGSSPLISEAAFSLRSERVGGVLRVLFPMRLGHSLWYQVEWTQDLLTWFDEGVTMTPRPDLGSGADWQMMQAEIPTGGRSGMMARLRVEGIVTE